ncbi:MgtC/SapB family protein [Vulcaniibacterium tengchongense]|uniref:Protein MgtC n=1 Tax=Vulcaniibacterium tengchongense TaxID=1273429 RepID=A0A3N4V507_9GAMM|nr:MgtC/SapB family protein [Vulcaniibacterium tengchongense]RPE77133.1 putative Mg2+ transporter-C (MgtC) family protein [Vulcaniibacterium tengchongense]
MDFDGQAEVLLGVAYAMGLGGVIGFERELKNRPAGFRTHMLVAGAAAFLVGLGQLLMFDPRYQMETLRVDPLRLVEAVVAGVSFIGAGTIFARRIGQAVAGITTAASLLTVAAIGVSVGLSYYLLAAAVTLLTLLVLTLLNAVERRLPTQRGERGK